MDVSVWGVEWEKALLCPPHIYALDVFFHIYKMEILLSSSQGY